METHLWFVSFGFFLANLPRTFLSCQSETDSSKLFNKTLWWNQSSPPTRSVFSRSLWPTGGTRPFQTTTLDWIEIWVLALPPQQDWTGSVLLPHCLTEQPVFSSLLSFAVMRPVPHSAEGEPLGPPLLLSLPSTSSGDTPAHENLPTRTCVGSYHLVSLLTLRPGVKVSLRHVHMDAGQPPPSRPGGGSAAGLPGQPIHYNMISWSLTPTKTRDFLES